MFSKASAIKFTGFKVSSGESPDVAVSQPIEITREEGGEGGGQFFVMECIHDGCVIPLADIPLIIKVILLECGRARP
jgi:hypothetical protein